MRLSFVLLPDPVSNTWEFSDVFYVDVSFLSDFSIFLGFSL